MPHTNARILTIDIETSPIQILHTTYDLKVNVRRFHPKEIAVDWTILGSAWKFLGEQARCISVSPKNIKNDYEVVRKLHELIQQADIIVGHNLDSFDVKKTNTRFIQYGLSALPFPPSIDTLKVARKHFKFTSNKLSHIANALGLDPKDESPDWEKVMAGDPEELAYMRQYNKQDVITTEELYLKLRPYIKNHPNMNLFIPEDVKGDKIYDDVCTNCGSGNISKNGKRVQGQGVYQRYICFDCGKFFLGKQNFVKIKVRP